MKTGRKGLELIKKFEGFYPKPYRDPVGIWTIGYGTTYYLIGSKKVAVKSTDKPLTEPEASKILEIQLATIYEPFVNQLVKKPLNQNQFDALVSFVYNLGASALQRSTLLKKINLNPNDTSIRAEFQKWRLAGGKVLPGLILRRNEEADLYFS